MTKIRNATVVNSTKNAVCDRQHLILTKLSHFLESEIATFSASVSSSKDPGSIM